jgi:hypothetical protein
MRVFNLMSYLQIQTIQALCFRKNKLCMSPSALGLLGILAVGTGITGCSTSMVEPGNYLPDSDSLAEQGTATTTDTDSSSESEVVVNCEDVDPCTDHGRCVVSDGESRCECDKGWDGEICDDCAAGWHLRGENCVLDEQCLSTSCAFHEVDGGCSVDDGVVECKCEGKWDADNHCATCLPGYHEKDDECVTDEYCVDGSRPCEHHGVCSEEAGSIICDCSRAGSSAADGRNWEGEYCEICPEGYHVDGDNCIPNESCEDDACGSNGHCVIVVPGTAACVCDSGWVQEDDNDDYSACTECATGYSHPDGDSSQCVPDAVCDNDTCGDGTCHTYTNGGIYCTCPTDSNLDPDQNCGACLTGFHFVSGTGCVEDAVTCAISDPCGDHGTCVYADGVKSCDCDPLYEGAVCNSCIDGYQDNDDNGGCAPDCETALANGLNCSGNGACSDSSGVAICECTDRWTGASCDECTEGNHLSSGECVANEVCQSDSCNSHGTCTVSSTTGLVACVCDEGWTDDGDDSCAVCVTGYQNTYDADSCQPSCATAVAAGLACGDHGDCALNTGTGEAFCDCDTGYAGDNCTMCDTGFHQEDTLCIANDASCEVNDPCGSHGTCVYSNGQKSCACDPLYSGDTCTVCVDGYQDNDGDGVCLPDCATARTNGLDCGDNGYCMITDGLAGCQCDTGYAGADCGSCASGYHPDYTLNECVANDECTQDGVNSSDCSGNGTCNDVTGIVACECNDGWDGLLCDVCASGYHSSGGDCLVNDSCTESGAGSTDCSGNGSCDDSGGAVVCTCDTGWTGASCNACASDYHSSVGDCVLNEQCTVNSCSGNGSCTVVDGLVNCSCATGYAGSYCDACATNYHIDYITGDCVADEACTQDGAGSSDCNGNGSCNDGTGIVSCTCDAGWTGTTCDVCADDYHLSSGDCVLNDQCQANSCNGHGTCSIVNGVLTCSCTGGFTAASYCADCTTGFHDGGGVCVLNESCNAGSCNGNGTCSVVSNEVVCSCDTGWTGDTCDACAAGYHDDSGECVLNESCIASSCSYHGACSVAAGVVSCSCSTGYTGDYCESCASGYHLNYVTGNCVADEACTQDGAGSSDCNGNGSCDDSTGIVLCTCEPEWSGEFCSVCNNGYHMDSDVCVVDTSCSASTCANGGTCDDSLGYVECTCVSNWDSATSCTTCVSGYHEAVGVCVVDETCDMNSCSGHGSCSVVGGLVSCSCDGGYAGDDCSQCDTGGGYSACDSVCCSSSETCYGGACVTPLTCTDLTGPDFVECGPTGVDDGAGGTVDCGDCGANGTCSAGVCSCDDNYGVLADEHECTYACDGYMPDQDCCDGNWLVYCFGGALQIFDCGNSFPNNTCGWSSADTEFSCADDTLPTDTDYTPVCPSNIAIDTEAPVCVDDGYEENDSDVAAYEITFGSGETTAAVGGTKCPNDYDIFSVYLDAGETITVTLEFTHSDINLDLGLWFDSMDESGFTTLLDYSYSSTSSNNREEITFSVGDPMYSGDPTTAGYYLIEIYEASGDSGGYLLTVTKS